MAKRRLTLKQGIKRLAPLLPRQGLVKQLGISAMSSGLTQASNKGVAKADDHGVLQSRLTCGETSGGCLFSRPLKLEHSIRTVTGQKRRAGCRALTLVGRSTLMEPAAVQNPIKFIKQPNNTSVIRNSLSSEEGVALGKQ